MKYFEKFREEYTFLILVLILSIPSLIGILHPGFFISDDGNWMVIRLSAFFETLRSGEFPVRFLSRLNNGYGYPVSDFLYPGFLYLGSLIHIFKIPYVETIKIIFGLSLLGSSIFSCLWLSTKFNKFVSLIGGVIYLYLPYHLFDIYGRGSIGEMLAIALLPAALLFIEKKYFGLVSISIFFLMISHNSLALLFLPIVIIYSMISSEKKSLFKLLTSIGIGILSSSFFIIPAVFDLKYTVFNQTKVSDYSQYFAPLNILGYLSIGTYLFAGIYTIIKREFKKEVFLFLIVGIISLFMASNMSKPIWNILPVNFIQFPFRFLSLSLISTAFLSTFLLSKLDRNQVVVGTVTVAVLLFYKNLYLIPKAYQDYPDGFYSTNQDSTTVKNEYMPIWVKNTPQSSSEKVNADVSNLTIKPNRVSFSTNQANDQRILVNTIYFPGWEVLVDSKKANIDYSNPSGLISFKVQSGLHNIVVKFSETPLRIFADILSLIGLLASLLLFSGTKKLKILRHD